MHVWCQHLQVTKSNDCAKTATARADSASADLGRLRRALMDAEIELQRVSTAALDHEKAHRIAEEKFERCQHALEKVQCSEQELSQARPSLETAAQEACAKVCLCECQNRILDMHELA
jgi:hypothetical protein